MSQQLTVPIQMGLDAWGCATIHLDGNHGGTCQTHARQVTKHMITDTDTMLEVQLVRPGLSQKGPIMEQGWFTSLVMSLVMMLSVQHASANFQEGEFVPTARRAQYQSKRTHWHDLLGRHCPRFGINKIAAVPLPHPTDLKLDGPSELDDLEYKISLSFDGERHHTSWLTIISKKWKGVPMVDVELVRSGSEIRAIRAKVVTAPKGIASNHANLEEEFRNKKIWPKHLIVRYTWTTINEVDVDSGLYVLFGSGLLMSAIVAFSVVKTYQVKLGQFLSDMTAEDYSTDVSVQRTVAGGFQPGKAD